MNPGFTETALLDGAVGMCWVATNVMLIWLALGLSRCAFPQADVAERLLHVAVLYTAEVIGVATLVGALGLLTGTALLATAWVFGGSCWIAFLRPTSRESDCSLSKSGLAATASDCRARFWLCFWGLAACLLASHLILHGLLQFPTEFDNLMYHIPVIDHWIQAGSLYAPARANWYIAGNNELVGLWMVAPFSGDFLIALNNVPIVVIWGTAIFELCRRLGMKDAWPHLVTLATVTVHALWHQTLNASNDIAVAAYFAAGCCYSLRYLESNHRSDLVMCAICLGALAGVKYFAVGYAVVLLATTAWSILLMRGLRSATIAGAVLLVGCLMMGGYWYIRNWFFTGAPMYPMSLSGPTAELGHPNLWETTFLGNGHPRLLEYGLSAVWRMTGPWHYAAVVLTPALALFLFSSSLVSNPASDSRSIARGAVLLWLLGSASVLMVTPYAVEDQPGTLNHLHWAYTPIRYGMCYLSMASIALGLFTCDTFQMSRKVGFRVVTVIAVAALSLVAAWQVGHRAVSNSRQFDYTTTAVVGFDLALLVLAGCCINRKLSRIVRALAASAVILAVSIAVGILSERWHSGFGKHFDRHFSVNCFHDLNVNVHPQRICVFGFRPYPFFGSRRQHFILNPRFSHSEEWMVAFTLENDVSLVAARRYPSGKLNRYKGALERLDADPKTFRKTSYNTGWHIFEVIEGNR